MNYYHEQETRLNKARKTVVILFGILGVLIGLLIYTGLQVKPQGAITVLKHSVENGRHSIMFSYTDTAALDNLTTQEYKAFVNKGILPKP